MLKVASADSVPHHLCLHKARWKKAAILHASAPFVALRRRRVVAVPEDNATPRAAFVRAGNSRYTTQQTLEKPPVNKRVVDKSF